MEKSKLQFSNPKIKKIDFRVNAEEEISDDIPVSIEIESHMNSELQEAIVKLNLIVGNIDDKSHTVLTSIYFNGVIAADFKWDDEIKNPESMLKISGGTVLLSYIRPILANLTLQAGIKPLNLPFINFTK